MRSLTPRQNAALKSAQTRWLTWIFSTKPANREQAEEGVLRTYRAGGVPEPEILLRFDDEVAPDAIWKAHGNGESYRITLPGVGMDALLENERHGLLFVDYLRLAFQWGGFPGFESQGQTPKEIEFLNEGLPPF
jgi:hypothetical protein